MNEEKPDLRIIVAENSVPIALTGGGLAFVLFYLAMTGYSGWDPLPAGAVATVALVIVIAGIYLIANKIVDTYTLEVSMKERIVYRQLKSMLKVAKGTGIDSYLLKIYQHTIDLIARTRESQPDKLLSAVTVLTEWFITILKLLKQYVDVVKHPDYFDDPQTRLKKGVQSLISFDTFLLNSIKTLEVGDNMDFDVAAKMLDSTRFTIV